MCTVQCDVYSDTPSGRKTWRSPIAAVGGCLQIHCGTEAAGATLELRARLVPQHGDVTVRWLSPLGVQGLLQPLDEVLLKASALEATRRQLLAQLAHLQPYEKEAATVCEGGCNRMSRRLQPYVLDEHVQRV